MNHIFFHILISLPQVTNIQGSPGRKIRLPGKTRGRSLMSGPLFEYNKSVLQRKGGLDPRESSLVPSARPVSWLAFILCHPFPERN
jgi:hypothetical protein